MRDGWWTVSSHQFHSSAPDIRPPSLRLADGPCRPADRRSFDGQRPYAATAGMGGRRTLPSWLRGSEDREPGLGHICLDQAPAEPFVKPLFDGQRTKVRGIEAERMSLVGCRLHKGCANPDRAMVRIDPDGCNPWCGPWPSIEIGSDHRGRSEERASIVSDKCKRDRLIVEVPLNQTFDEGDCVAFRLPPCAPYPVGNGEGELWPLAKIDYCGVGRRHL